MTIGRHKRRNAASPAVSFYRVAKMQRARERLPPMHFRSALRDRSVVGAIVAELLASMIFTILSGASNNDPLVTAFSFAALGTCAGRLPGCAGFPTR